MAIQVTDKSTGEYLTFDYASFEDFAEEYDEITQRIKGLERARDKMNSEIMSMMGDEPVLQLTNGWYFKKYEQTRKSYNVTSVMGLMKKEALKFLKVDKTKLDAEIKLHSLEKDGIWPALTSELIDSLEVIGTSESLRLVKPS